MRLRFCDRYRDRELPSGRVGGGCHGPRSFQQSVPGKGRDSELPGAVCSGEILDRFFEPCNNVMVTASSVELKTFFSLSIAGQSTSGPASGQNALSVVKSTSLKRPSGSSLHWPDQQARKRGGKIDLTNRVPIAVLEVRGVWLEV